MIRTNSTTRPIPFRPTLVVVFASAIASVPPLGAGDISDSHVNAPDGEIGVPTRDGVDDYPPILRSRIVEVTTEPRLRDDVLELGGEMEDVSVPWKGDEEDQSPVGSLKAIGDVVHVDPNTEYTFELLRLHYYRHGYDCDDVEIGYDFQALATLLLRIRQGDRIVFDAHVRARSRLRGAVPSDAVPKRDASLVALLEEVVQPGVPCNDGAELIQRFQGDWSEPGRPTWDVFVYVEQPGAENAVAALVHDPAARGRRSVDVVGLEGACPSTCYSPGRPGECLTPGHRAELWAVAPQSGVFVGLVEIESAHGAVVEVEYVRPADSGPRVVRDSQPTSMAFH